MCLVLPNRPFCLSFLPRGCTRVPAKRLHTCFAHTTPQYPCHKPTPTHMQPAWLQAHQLFPSPANPRFQHIFYFFMQGTSCDRFSSFYAHVHGKYFPMQRLPKHSSSRRSIAHLTVHGLVPSVACPFEAPLLIPHVLVTTRSTLLQVASCPDALARPRSAPTNRQVYTYAQ